MFLNLYDNATIPTVGSSITLSIPDGQPRIPLSVSDFAVMADEEGDALIATVVGKVLASGSYGHGVDARFYEEGDEILVYLASGDYWE